MTLHPSLCPAGSGNCTVTDDDIQNELTAQITAGVLPKPSLDCTGNAETIYMIEFPPQVAVAGPDGAGTSCVDFCAYHNTGTFGTSNTPLIYGVLMDEYTSACATGCGGDPTALENSTDTASHELAEAVTDPDIGLDTQVNYAKPAAWGDNNNLCGEVADICDSGGAGDTITVSGRSWVVQELWSNKQNKCTSTGPANTCPSGDVCGTVAYGCTTMSCGTCTAPQTCNANKCTTCTPITSCPVQDNCGSVSDGCGGTLNCGTCTAPQTCGGGGTANVCGCTPAATCPAGINCGSIPNGCGGTLFCGACTAPQTCGGGGTPNVCGCSPLASCPVGANCGTLPNGCGGTLVCGSSCTAPQTCGGGGVANVCGCTPLTACPAGDDCGSAPDGCGGTIDCGSCTGGQTCVANVCTASTPDAGSSSDAGGAADSATPVPDSGTTTPDSGATGNDSGATATDSGAAADTGTPAADGGAPMNDSGTLESDSGSAFADSGTSIFDSGSSSTGDSSVAEMDASGDAAEGDGSPLSSTPGNSGGCGCRTAGSRGADSTPGWLGLGIGLMIAGVRLRRRSRREQDQRSFRG